MEYDNEMEGAVFDFKIFVFGIRTFDSEESYIGE